MKTSRRIASLFVAVATLAGFASCQKEDDTNVTAGPTGKTPASAINVAPAGDAKTAKMKVKMIDAPSAYAFQQVNVNVQSMAGLITTDDGQQTWVNLGADASVYNAIELVNGESAEISNATILAGHLSQIQITFGSSNSVVLNGQTQQVELTGPASVMVNVDYDIAQDEEFELMLDFDVASSLIAQGSSSQGGIDFALNPTVHIFSSNETSELSGQLMLGGGALIVASNGQQSFSTYANANGYFMLQGMPQGSYTVTAYLANGLSINLGNNVQVGFNLNLNLGLLANIG